MKFKGLPQSIFKTIFFFAAAGCSFVINKNIVSFLYDPSRPTQNEGKQKTKCSGIMIVMPSEYGKTRKRQSTQYIFLCKYLMLFTRIKGDYHFECRVKMHHFHDVFFSLFCCVKYAK